MRRIFRPEEKAEAVRLADECGNDLAITRRLGLAQGAVGRWRAEGWGRVMTTTTGSSIERPTHTRTAHPSMRCPSCCNSFSIQGEATNLNRLRAWEAHYEASPTCEAKNRRRVS